MLAIEEIHQRFIDSTGISTDSRSIKEGQMFVALKGPNFNANEYALSVLEKGASFAIIDEVQNVSDDRLILVNDGLKTLQDLANYHRKQFNIPVIGITGSNGKTTNKELVMAVLSKKYTTLCTKGNFNNHIGVPLTLLNLTKEHEVAIVEMGANHKGEIAELCKIAEPNHALITSIGIAHLEGFGNIDTIKRTKKELFDFVIQNGEYCFINESVLTVPELFDGSDRQSVKYGSMNHQPCYSKLYQNPFLSLTINLAENDHVINSNLLGEFQADNILNAIAIGLHFKVNIVDIIDAIERYEPDNNRSEVKEINGNTVIFDAYNANPTSMLAAIDTFKNQRSEARIVILGDMLELGKDSHKYHAEVVNHLNHEHFEVIILVGELFYQCDCPKTFLKFKNTEEARSWWLNQKFENHLVLLKGSRGIGLEKIFL